MTGLAISQLPLQDDDDTTSFYLAGVDLTKPAGSRDRQISAAGMLAFFKASLPNDGGTFSQNATGVVVPANNNFVDSILYTPSSATSDVVLVGLEIAQASIASQPFYFEVWAGVPTGTGVRVYASEGTGGTPVIINTASTYLTSTLYIPKVQGSTTLYIRICNTGPSPMVCAFQAWCLEFPGNGIVLPQYEPPPPYLGPLLSTVHVGAAEQFLEPQYAMQAIADGGTIFVDAGHYYLPIGLLTPASGNNTTIPNYGGTSANASNRFLQGITLKGAGAYQTIFNGRGGIGNGYRLTQGKGFIYTQAPILVQGVQFISCGGADHVGDGESGIYAENFPTSGTVTVASCAFDNNEDGLFSPEANPASGTSNGANVNIVLNQCDFGFEAPNGASADGLSHDFYLNCASVVVNGCNFYGSLGNCVKSRSPSLTINGGWIRHDQGRCIDYPNGGTLTVDGTTLLGAIGCVTNFIEYAAEAAGDGWSNPISNPQMPNCTVINTRYGELVWMAQAAPAAFEFTNPIQQYYVYPGASGGAPFLVFNRDGGSEDNDPSVCTGLTSGVAGTTITSLSVPGSVAAPGYTPSSFTAWNGTV